MPGTPFAGIEASQGPWQGAAGLVRTEAPTPTTDKGDEPSVNSGKLQRSATFRSWIAVLISWLLFAPRATANITISAPPSLRVQAARLETQIAPTLMRIGVDFDIDPATLPPFELRVTSNREEFQEQAPAGRDAPPWASGVAYLQERIMLVALAHDGEALDAEATVRHETTHLALAALWPDAPRWLHEGYARVIAREGSLEDWQALATMAWSRNLQTADALNALLLSDEHRVGRGYMQAGDFVRFLIRRGRWADADDDGNRVAWMRFVRAARTMPIDQAARVAYGTTMATLWSEWQVDLRARTMWGPLAMLASLAWVALALAMGFAFWRQRRRNHERILSWEATAAAEASLQMLEQRVASTAVVPAAAPR